uniref:Uncharacterized protein n=1 Tax=viral metagenome TaxID=1070528 RepID=A0A6C0KIQ2_9ZZZZ
MTTIKEMDKRLSEIKKELAEIADLDKPEGSIMKRKHDKLMGEAHKLLNKIEDITDRIYNSRMVKSGGKRKTKRVLRKSSKKSKTAKKSKTSKRGRKNHSKKSHKSRK